MSERILDQRYQLDERIGSGGMADVYKATDILLNRPVAVKILHDQFKRDTEFINKFQREARAAARLSHPNIVNIYDVGVSEGDHYIVMEYVPGKTLKDKIRQDGHLSTEEALRIAREIAEALAHAHANGLVHCDIKPHNILMMADGHIKVADFGIARAVTESTMTYSGNVVGSVHYFSPEQAKGTMITPKSDVYSLGVVLYEMLTGRIPFTGETPVSIALKHLQETPVPVREINPTIPASVEDVVDSAMQKDPELRPTSEELIHTIQQAERMLFSGMPEQDPYATQMMSRVQAPENIQEPTRDFHEEQEERKSVFKSRTFIIGLMVVLVVGFFVGTFMSYGKFWSTAEVEVPDVTGKSMALARQILEDKKLRVDVAETYDASVPAGQVVSQDPAGGSKVKEQRLVTIYVSKGGEEVDMPDLVGLSKADAIAKIEKTGLKVGTVYEKYSAQEPGTVVSQDPKKGAKRKRGDTVDITVSKGRETKKVHVPSVVGKSYQEAESILKANGLAVGNVTKQASREAADTVLSQSQQGTDVEEGTSISLVVATPQKDAEKANTKDAPKTGESAPGNVPSKNEETAKTR